MLCLLECVKASFEETVIDEEELIVRAKLMW